MAIVSFHFRYKNQGYYRRPNEHNRDDYFRIRVTHARDDPATIETLSEEQGRIAIADSPLKEKSAEQRTEMLMLIQSRTTWMDYDEEDFDDGQYLGNELNVYDDDYSYGEDLYTDIDEDELTYQVYSVG